MPNLSETIELATSEAVEEIIDMYLVHLPGYNQNFLNRIADHLLAHYKTDEPAELGPALDRDLVLSVGHDDRQ